MKVLFLARPEHHPATRYRVLQYLPHLCEHGIEASFSPFPETKTFFGWLRIFKEKGSPDVVVIQKKRLGRLALWAVRRRCKSMLYDLDDAVMFDSSRHPSPDSPRRMAAFQRMATAVDGIIAGSEHLKELAEQFNKRVWVVPTSIDTSKYQPKISYAPEGGEDKVVLGWIGGRKSLSLLVPLAPVLERLARKFGGLRLKIVGAPSGERCGASSLQVTYKPWSESDEACDVASFDIGIAPLPDHPWAAGKCSTKLLQCMAAGVPCVASPVGSQKEVVTDAVNGLLASGDEEWHEKLSALISDASLREKLGKAGRRHVEESYSLAVSAPRLAAILKTSSRPDL